MNYIRVGAKVLFDEAHAIVELAGSLGNEFVEAVNLIVNCQGSLIFSGVGKSGHIGKKLAATFASTGTPSFFVHADEAAHGDLGMIRQSDVLIGISFSGESDELLRIIPILKKMNVPIISMTGRAESSLAQLSDICLLTPIQKEACPLNLAPTSSTTVTLALGDALACAVMVAKGFTKEDFAKSHPAGALGRRLLLTVKDIEKVGDTLPCVEPQVPAIDAISKMSHSHLGCFVVVEGNVATGIFTEGDLSRVISEQRSLQGLTAIEIAHKNPITISQSQSAYLALKKAQEFKIHQLVVVDDAGHFVGIVHKQDLVAAKLGA